MRIEVARARSARVNQRDSRMMSAGNTALSTTPSSEAYGIEKRISDTNPMEAASKPQPIRPAKITRLTLLSCA